MNKMMFHSEYGENMKGDLVFFGDNADEIFKDLKEGEPMGTVMGEDKRNNDYPFIIKESNGNISCWRYIAYDCN